MPHTDSNGFPEHVRISIVGLDNPSLSQSLLRGLAILTCFTPERPVWSLAEITAELNMSRTSTQKYVETFVFLDYLEQFPSATTQHQYRLSLRVTDLGLSALNSTSLVEHSRPYLERLRQESGWTPSVAVLDGSEIVYIERIPAHLGGQSAFEKGLAAGSRLPAYCTALGKMLLASLPDDEQEQLLHDTILEEHTRATITNRQALRSELDEIHAVDFALSDGEYMSGLQALAAPIRNVSGHVVAAIGVSAHGIEAPMCEIIANLLPRVGRAANAMSFHLGFRL